MLSKTYQITYSFINVDDDIQENLIISLFNIFLIQINGKLMRLKLDILN